MNSLFDVTGRVVIVTGGNRGIGLALAKGFANAGAQVVITNRTPETGEAAAREVGNGTAYIRCDVADPESIQALVKETVERFGRIDVLINNAATRVKKLGVDHTLADWQEILHVNVTSCALMSQEVVPHMARQGGGKIIHISSISAIRAFVERTSYCATKGALDSLALAQAAEWAQHNIQVNCLSPGSVLPLGQPVPDNPRIRAAFDHIPAGRSASADDLVGTAIFLSAKASDYITGQAIQVDGGWSVMPLPLSLFFPQK